MKKLKALWSRIPRPCRGLINLAGIILLIFLFYTSIGGMPLSRVQAFRRMERAHFVGPSNILFNEELEGMLYDNILVAESDYGVSTYVHHMQNGKLNGEFNYFPKTGRITVVSAPYTLLSRIIDFGIDIPVFVIDDYPEAKRAELSLSVTGIYSYHFNDGEKSEEKKFDLNQNFTAQSQRKQKGIFCFTLTAAPEQHAYSANKAALEVLTWTFTRWGRSMVDEANITATVRLYDENDALITEQELLLKPPVP